MRFFEVVLSGAALISAALAVEFNSWPSSVKASETITLTYSPKDAATTIILRKGPSTDLDTLDTLTTSSTGGSFEWTVPSSLADGDDYAFEIRQDGASPNYSGQFALSGGSAASSAASSSAVSSTAASSAASSSSAGYATGESSSASSSAVSSAVSSTFSTLPITSSYAASASSTILPSGSNSTISTGAPTKTGSQGPTSTSNEPPIENTGAASSLGHNPVAIFMGALAAVAYLA